ncbi:Uncharacterized protein Fot_36873 [Forsythia ovata]|uniref:Uncharacterized protein n=1 Tax=Forsythia ovata TaxID=205694 RepID=A0ABD1SQV0_9LAMI
MTTPHSFVLLQSTHHTREQRSLEKKNHKRDEGCTHGHRHHKWCWIAAVELADSLSFWWIGAQLGLVAFALLILACLYRKSSLVGESSNDAEEKPAKSVDQVLQPEIKPRIVVIMA